MKWQKHCYSICVIVFVVTKEYNCMYLECQIIVWLQQEGRKVGIIFCTNNSLYCCYYLLVNVLNNNRYGTATCRYVKFSIKGNWMYMFYLLHVHAEGLFWWECAQRHPFLHNNFFKLSPSILYYWNLFGDPKGQETTVVQRAELF